MCVPMICSCFCILQDVPHARIRSYCGTENVSIATCQMAFRHDHDDQFAGGSSFIFGSSIRNIVNNMCFVAFILTHGS